MWQRVSWVVGEAGLTGEDPWWSNPRAPTSDLQRNHASPLLRQPSVAAVLQPKCVRLAGCGWGPSGLAVTTRLPGTTAKRMTSSSFRSCPSPYETPCLLYTSDAADE